MAWQLVRLAARNLVRNRRRTLISLAALAVGAGAAVCVRGFLNGLQESLVQGVTAGGQGALQVHRHGFLASMESVPLAPDLEVSAELLDRIEHVPGVSAASPRIPFAGMLSVGEQTVFAVAVAVDPERERRVSPLRPELVTSGAWFPASAPRGVLVGMELAQGLSVRPGAEAALLTHDVDGVMNGADVRVAGTLAAPTQGEKKLVLLPLALGQELLRMPGRATEVAVQVRDLDDVPEVAPRLREALGPDYDVTPWTDAAPFVLEVRKTQDTALEYVILTFLFIMMMGVTNTQLMSVLERVREIGTMMAVGMRRRHVLLLFLLEAVMLGVLGAVTGMAAGALLVKIAGTVGVPLTTPGASLPTVLHPFTRPLFLLRILGLGVGGGAVASLYPAWKASRMRPVEALAHV